MLTSKIKNLKSSFKTVDFIQGVMAEQKTNQDEFLSSVIGNFFKTFWIFKEGRGKGIQFA
jgi:hypothetical protein